MTDQPGFLFTVLMFVLVIGPLVFVHELGHYLVGRWFGVHAEAFSIGFGRSYLHGTIGAARAGVSLRSRWEAMSALRAT